MNRVEQLVEEQGSLLVDDARSALLVDPYSEVVGLIAEDLAFKELPDGGRPFDGGARYVVPRASAVVVLKAIAPRALEWLEPSTPDQLPVIVALRQGTQLTTLPL